MNAMVTIESICIYVQLKAYSEAKSVIDELPVFCGSESMLHP